MGHLVQWEEGHGQESNFSNSVIALSDTTGATYTSLGLSLPISKEEEKWN
jgi:hypothetical protein